MEQGVSLQLSWFRRTLQRGLSEFPRKHRFTVAAEMDVELFQRRLFLLDRSTTRPDEEF